MILIKKENSQTIFLLLFPKIS